jgi:hypothetical protein
LDLYLPSLDSHGYGFILSQLDDGLHIIFLFFASNKWLSFFLFWSTRGICQGCISPFLFLIVTEGLNKLLKQDQRDWILKGLKITSSEVLSHFLFVDDVILFGASSLQEHIALKKVQDDLCVAFVMQTNFLKSNLFTNAISEDIMIQLDVIIPFARNKIDDGFKYLGFILKPNSYSYGDWIWIVQKIQERLINWAHRWLSRGGRLTLFKLVLSSIHVYWETIAKIPSNILTKIGKVCFHFLWSCKKDYGGMPLVKCTCLVMPKDLRGWGIKNINWFY